jgi:hypothetical protein
MKAVYMRERDDIPGLTLGKIYSVVQIDDKHSYWEKFEVVNDNGIAMNIFSYNFISLEEYRKNLIEEILK